MRVIDMVSDLFVEIFEIASPFVPFLLVFCVTKVMYIFIKHFVWDLSFCAGFCGRDSSEDDETNSKKSDFLESEQKNSIGSISVYSVLLDKEIFCFEGDYAKQIKKGRLTVFYTENDENKAFSCDLGEHIIVKER